MTTRPVAGTWWGALVGSRWQQPLYRNGYSLLLNSALTAALGLVFWVVAARLYTPEAVGVGAALITAMSLLGDLSHLNLRGALNRFLPSAGTRAARFTRISYTVALSVGGVAGIAFVLGIDVWAPDLGVLRDEPAAGALFVASTMAWAIFVLQGATLTGIRRATWVPVQNLAFSVAKIVLLLAVAASMPSLGVFVAWSLPAVALIVPMGLLIFRRLIPAHVRETQHRSSHPGLRGIVSYIAADYAAFLVWTATVGVLPLVVLNVLGPADAAYYYLAWTIAYGLYLISSSMCDSMMAEAALDPAGLRTYSRKAAKEAAALVIPAAAVVAVGAPWILALIGEDYAEESSTTLRLLALSAIPYIIIAVYVRIRSVQRRMRAVVWITSTACAIVLGLGGALLGPLGITGLAIGWLAGLTACALWVTGGHVVEELRASPRGRIVRGASGAARRIRRLPGGRARGGRLQRALTDAAEAGLPEAAGWVVQRQVATPNEVGVAFVGPAGGSPAAVLKLAETARQDPVVARGAAALARIHRVQGLDGRTRALVPRVLAAGRSGGRRFVVESLADGAAADGPAGAAGDWRRAAAAAVAALHDATSRAPGGEAPGPRGRLSEAVAAIAPAVARRSRVAGAPSVLRALETLLAGDLDGARPAAGWIHGDLCGGNVLVDPATGRVSGLIDWDEARPDGLAQVDVAHMLLTSRALAEGRELGGVVVEWLGGRGWTADERAILALSSSGGAERLHERTVVLLAWLAHVSANVGKSERYERSRRWMSRNVDEVLRALAREDDRDGAGPARRAWAIPLVSRGDWPSLVALAAAAAAWGTVVTGVDPRAMTDFGLLSVLPPAFHLALGLLTCSFVLLVHRRPHRTGLLAMHVTALVVVLHATPAVVYGTLRYPWAWKHLGIVDFIQRHDALDTTAVPLDVYHSWPGFFAAAAGLQDLAGLDNLRGVATWSPAAFTLLAVGAVLLVLSSLTRDRRVVWMGAWMYVIVNWVGQEYFSPQAMAFVLYLLVIGIVLRWLGAPSSVPPRLPRRLAARLEWPATEAVAEPLRSPLVALVVLLVAVITTTHLLTSVLVILSLGALVLVGRCAVRSLPLIAAALGVAWWATAARDYVGANLRDAFDSIAPPWVTTEDNLVDATTLAPDQATVVTVTRLLVLVVAALAVVGLARLWRRRALDPAALVLAGVPMLLFATGDYEGELIFRIYLFSSPFLALFAVHALPGFSGRPRRRGAGAAVATAAASAVVSAVLLAGFLVAYYGKDRLYYFTPQEIAAAESVYREAPPGSLLIQGTRDVPVQFENYERLTYVTLADESPETRRRVLGSPATVIGDWMEDGGHRAAYVLITRSQKLEVEALGSLPRGSLERIELALERSPRFTVVRTRDAMVATLRTGGTG